jgi:hypothetical protein
MLSLDSGDAANRGIVAVAAPLDDLFGGATTPLTRVDAAYVRRATTTTTTTTTPTSTPTTTMTTTAAMTTATAAVWDSAVNVPYYDIVFVQGARTFRYDANGNGMFSSLLFFVV